MCALFVLRPALSDIRRAYRVLRMLWTIMVGVFVVGKASTEKIGAEVRNSEDRCFVVSPGRVSGLVSSGLSIEDPPGWRC